jgi:hypothetical protein
MSEQILQNRVYFKDRYNSLTPEILVKGAWISTALALILTIPSLMAFVGIYYSFGSMVLGALIGFSLHFATLAFAGRISSALESLFD